MVGVYLRESVLADHIAWTVTLQEDTCFKEKATAVSPVLLLNHQNMLLSWKKCHTRYKIKW